MRSIYDRPIFLAGMFAGLILAINEIRFETSMPFGGDFAQIWVAGTLANDHAFATLYDRATFSAAGLALIENFYRPVAHWSYPPTALLIGSPLAFLPYHAALAVFSTFQTLLAAWTGMIATRRRMQPFWGAMIAVASPALIVSLVFGQFSAPVGCLLVLGVFALERRPALASVIFALAVLKPQFGLLVPIALAVAGAWRAFFSAAATVIGFAALAGLIFGPDIWIDFVTKTLPQQTGLIGDMSNYGPVGHSVRDTLLLAGAPRSLATAVQAFAALVAVLATASVFHRTSDAPLRAFVLTLASTTLLPYANLYDAAIPAFGALALYGSPKPLHPAVLAAIMIIWLSPVVDAFLGVSHLFKFAPLFEAGVLAVVLIALEKPAWQSHFRGRSFSLLPAART